MISRHETSGLRLPAAHPSLEPIRTILPNGIVVLTKETRTIPAVAINLAVRAGSACDRPEQPGAMHVLSRVIDRGTETRTAADVAEELDNRGITLTISVTRHALSLACTCLTEDFEAAFTLLGDIVRSPVVPDSELAKRKAEVITAIRQDEDNPATRAVESLMSLLYPDPHPYGRPAKGTLNAVDGLTREALLALHRERVAPSELIAVVVGDVPGSQVTDVVSRVLGDWRAARPAPIVPPGVTPAGRRQRLVIPMMNKAQADVAYGFTTIRRADPAYYAFWLMNNVLGQYAMGGRLGESIRERQGMAYYAFSSLDANVAEGPLMIRAGISPANVDRAIASIDDEIRRLARDGVTAQELRDSQQYLIGSMPRALETNVGIANFLHTAEFFELGLDYDRRLPALLRAVTREHVQQAAQRVLDPDRATIVIAGPYEERRIG
jgi:zinc protease